MKRKVVKKNGRDKAFTGAIVGTVAGIAGNLISANKKKKAEELAFKQAQEEQTRVDGIQQANVMSTAYANQDYIKSYQNKVSLKAGGKMKIKKSNNADRISKTKKFAMGGRKKAEGGAKLNVGNEVAGAAGGIGGLVTSLLTKPSAPKIVKKADGFNYGVAKTGIEANSYELGSIPSIINPMDNVINNPVSPIDINTNINTNPLYNDRIKQAKFGKRITKRSAETGL